MKLEILGRMFDWKLSWLRGDIELGCLYCVGKALFGVSMGEMLVKVVILGMCPLVDLEEFVDKTVPEFFEFEEGSGIEIE